MDDWFKHIKDKNSDIEKSWGVNPLDSIEKATKDISKLVKKEITVNRGGKTFRQTVYVKAGEDIETPVGGDISPTVNGMNITKYSDKALLITGDTYVNVETLRSIKKEVGVGNWNNKLKGWVFPMKFVDTVLGYIWSDLKDKGEDDKADAVQNQKNAGLEKGDKAGIQGIEGEITENVSNNEGTKYNVNLKDGTKLENVDEKVIETTPSTDDKKIAEIINNTSAEGRVKSEKKIYGIKPIEDIQNYSLQEYMGMHGLSQEDIQKVVDSFSKPKKETPKKTGSGGGGKSGGYTKKGQIEGLSKQQLIRKLVYQHYQAVKQSIEAGKEIKPEALALYNELKEVYAKKRKAMSEETKRKISEALKKNKADEAKKAAQKMIDSLSVREIEKIKNSFKEAISDVVKKEQSILAELVAEKEKLEKEKYSYWDKARELSNNYGKAEVWKAKARLVSKDLDKLETKVRAQQNKVQAISNGGDTLSLSDKVGVEYKEVPDFRKVPAMDIEYNIDNILTADKPDYIPEINFDEFKSGSYIFDMIKVDDDSYLLATNKYREKSIVRDGLSVSKDGEYDPNGGGFVMLTLDQLVLTQDYYVTKQKAIFKQEAARKNQRQEEYWDKKADKDKERWMMQRGMYRSLPAKIRKEVTEAKWDSLTWQEREKLYKPIKKYGSEKIKSRFDTKHMAGSFHSMYERFVNPEAERTDRSGKKLKRDETSYSPRAASEAWSSWTNFRQTLDWKINDINIQREELSDVRKKALETSYGDTNTNNTYVDELGVKMKRQNGSTILPKEMDQLKDAWTDVQKSFGSLKENAKKDNLKLSHAGKTHMYASKAIGVYYPSFKAIGVTAKLGEDQLGFTMGHEVAHWIDNTLGGENGRRYASDNYDSTAGKIANTLRKNMNTKSDSKYLNNTKECMARALEMYHAIESKGSYAVRVGKDLYTESDAYVSKEVYDNQLKPLIKQFFEENKEFLKSLENTLFNF